MGIKQEYNSLLQSGELLELHPELSGIWAKDKEIFTNSWNQNKEAIDDIEIYIDDDNDE